MGAAEGEGYTANVDPIYLVIGGGSEEADKMNSCTNMENVIISNHKGPKKGVNWNEQGYWDKVYENYGKRTRFVKIDNGSEKWINDQAIFIAFLNKLPDNVIVLMAFANDSVKKFIGGDFRYIAQFKVYNATNDGLGKQNAYFEMGDFLYVFVKTNNKVQLDYEALKKYLIFSDSYSFFGNDDQPNRIRLRENTTNAQNLSFFVDALRQQLQSDARVEKKE